MKIVFAIVLVLMACSASTTPPPPMQAGGWEEIAGPNRKYYVCRQRTPHGWLVIFRQGYGGGMAYVPDENMEWGK